MHALREKIALVAGSSRGIGRAVAELLAQHGATVVLTARTASDLERVAATIRKADGRAFSIPGDITDEGFVGRSFKTIRERSQRLLEEGWSVLRISPLDGMEDGFDPKRAILRGVEYFSALRNAVGEEVEVIFEVHTRLTPIRAIELCNAIAEFRPFFVEDPIRSENPASFATLRAHTAVPIGTGEQLTTKWAFRELIEQELIDYLRVDICHTGGITEGKKIAALGEVHYQELACHYTSSPVSTAAMLHLNLSVPNCAVQEYAPASAWMNEVIEHKLTTEAGYLLCPDVPGLGIDLHEEAAASYPHAPGEPPHWRREDGSVQDW